MTHLKTDRRNFIL